MARGTSLTELLDMLRSELGMSSDPSLSQSNRANYVSQLNRAQDWYLDDFDWPFLRVRSDKLTSAGQRYYDFPSDINLERIDTVQIYWGGTWLDICRGIDMHDYTSHDSDADVRLDPVLKWDVIDVGSGPQFEVWPIPITSSLTIRFTGFKTVARMVDGADTAALDDHLIVLTAAAKLAARMELPDADEFPAAARRRYDILRASSTNDRIAQRSFAMRDSTSGRRPHQIIAVHREE